MFSSRNDRNSHAKQSQRTVEYSRSCTNRLSGKLGRVRTNLLETNQVWKVRFLAHCSWVALSTYDHAVLCLFLYRHFMIWTESRMRMSARLKEAKQKPKFLQGSWQRSCCLEPRRSFLPMSCRKRTKSLSCVNYLRSRKPYMSTF